MTRDEFKAFVDKTLDELILYAEIHADKSFLGFKLKLCWGFYSKELVEGREQIIEEITQKVFIDPDNIYPCVDLWIEVKLKAKELKIMGGIAGHKPRPFGRGWSNRPGPFIYAMSKGINSSVDTSSPEFFKKLKDLGLIHYDRE